MSDLDEFLAEAMKNPQFAAAYEAATQDERERRGRQWVLASRLAQAALAFIDVANDEVERLVELSGKEFSCPADPCPFCTAAEELQSLAMMWPRP